MNQAGVASRLRVFLLALALCMSVGAIVELWLEEHTGGFVQWIPFGLAVITLATTGLVLIRPKRGAIHIHRLAMVLVMLGGAYGVYTHLIHNYEFERDIRPTASAGEHWMHALSGGSPLLAPGIMTITALLAIAGTHGHPALARSETI